MIIRKIIVAVFALSLVSASSHAQTLRENLARGIDVDSSTICPLSGVRGESLTYVAADDSLWISNDFSTSLCGIDRFTEANIQVETRGGIFQSFWSDNGLHSDELEIIASDGNDLYMINNVNKANECNPITDVATIYRLTRPGDSGTFTIAESWELPTGNDCSQSDYFTYKAAVVIDGSIYVADSLVGEIHLYDYEANTIPTFFTSGPRSPALSITSGPPIVDLAYDGTFLWVLQSDGPSDSTLTKFHWDTKTEVVSYDLQNMAGATGKWGGVAVVGKEIYLVLNVTPSKIHVFSEP